MTPVLRARLSWLHRWTALVAGWIVFAIFFTGTLSLFDAELTRWMQPESAEILPEQPLSDQALEHAMQILRDDERQGKPSAFLSLPSARDPLLHIFRYDGHALIGPALNPRDGRLIATRQTEGGAFFFNFHYTLRLPSPWGEYLVALTTFFLSLLILSGVLLHLSRLIPDYFTLRLHAATPRCLLDLHVLTGTAMLPFHIMITWTGLFLLGNIAFPLISHDAAPLPPAVVEHHHLPTFLLAPLVHKTERLTGNAVTYILFSAEHIAIYSLRPDSLSIHDTPMTFDNVTGQAVAPPPPDRVERAEALLTGLHMAHTMGPVLRWLWFLGGLAATVMVASGLVFHTARRRASARQLTSPRLERLNAGIMSGLVFASLAYLWTNRLIPYDWKDRSMLEITTLFVLWGSTALLAFGLPRAVLWSVPLALTALAGLGIPLLDLLTGPSHLWRHSLFLSVDAVCALTGLAALSGALWMRPRT
ncbi:putative iron-regulated membrane protein [Acetobacter estunensis NRIC 0472]|uniref:PepSY domain-containing protein n=1 Tax=Acetobacter estunensis TaxID=104097 RepID=A0A967EII8_9PROT|nr:PepSY-associated TM helix domain-containing protein [Acetobacter estunensis]NHO53319.1 hypothetical protein [Acetobacter estunensis]GBQ22051.1 putative iron-regulated membrane protein [Acetobacter estunensis NRIC 0472]